MLCPGKGQKIHTWLLTQEMLWRDKTREMAQQQMLPDAERPSQKGCMQPETTQKFW